MGKSKRKRGVTGPTITPLGPKIASPAEPPAPTSIKASAPTPQSATPSADKKVHTVHASHGLRQYTASSNAQQFSGNHAGYLKVQYLAKIANWAATTVPNLGAFLGQRLAAASEALAIPPPTDHSLCQRCETVLHVGENCSVRVTQAPKKWRKAKARGIDAGIKNAVVYHCHFCKFENKQPGTARGHVKTKASQSAALSQMTKLGSSKTSTATPTLTQQKKSVGTIKTPAATPALAQETKSIGSSSAPAATPALSPSKNLGNNKTPATALPVGNLARLSAIASPMVAALSPLASLPASPNAVAQAASGGKKRKRKGWSTLKDLTTSQVELPTPTRLGFMGTLNADKKG